MAQRNTNTDKWSKRCFRRLSPSAKLLYLYILDNCDIAGIWEIDIEKVAFETGLCSESEAGRLFDAPPAQVASIEAALVELEAFLIAPAEGLHRGYVGATKAVFVREFLELQNNLPLNVNNACHRGILKRIESSNGLQEHILAFLQAEENQRGYIAPTQPLARGLGKGKGKGNKGGVGGNDKTAAELADEYAAQQAARRKESD